MRGGYDEIHVTGFVFYVSLETPLRYSKDAG